MLMKSRRMRMTGVWENRNAYRVLVEKPEGGDSLEGLGMEGWIILKWIIQEKDARAWTELIWVRIETSGGLCQTQ